MYDKQCVLCDTPITSDNTTREHIIPMAIGGRRTVTGFICRACNSKTGQTWDAKLAEQLKFLSLFLGIRRQKGTVPSMRIPTLGGDEIEMRPNQQLTLAPTFEKTICGKSTRIDIRARSIHEMHDRLKDIKRRYPTLDLQGMLSDVESHKVYVDDPMTLTVDCGGPESSRAMVKSTVALAFDAGVDPADCDLAVEYLRNEDAEQCFYAYYERDLVRNRKPGNPLHCVYVAGSPADRTIMGYVELYGIIRKVVCLAKNYSGEEFSRLYVVDPTGGATPSVDMANLRLAEYVAAESQTQETLSRGMVSAANDVIGTGQAAARRRELDRLIVEGWNRYLNESGKGEGDEMTEEDIRALTSRIMDSLTPFLLHIIEPMAVPDDMPRQDT